MRTAIMVSAALGVLAASPAFSQSGRDYDRYQMGDDRRSERYDRDAGRERDGGREGRSEREMSYSGHHGHQGHHGGGRDGEGMSGARFQLQSGDLRLSVRCGEGETMRACLDVTLTLMERARSMQPTSSPAPTSSPPSTAPAPMSSPPSTAPSPNPAPSPSRP